MYFTSTVEELVKQNSNRRSDNKLEIKHCPNSIFIYPITEEEMISLTQSLKSKPTVGYDDIPESLVKYVYRVIHKSLRNFRTRLRNNQERQGRKEHINR